MLSFTNETFLNNRILFRRSAQFLVNNCLKCHHCQNWISLSIAILFFAFKQKNQTGLNKVQTSTSFEIKLKIIYIFRHTKIPQKNVIMQKCYFVLMLQNYAQNCFSIKTINLFFITSFFLLQVLNNKLMYEYKLASPKALVF